MAIEWTETPSSDDPAGQAQHMMDYCKVEALRAIAEQLEDLRRAVDFNSTALEKTMIEIRRARG
ncbi:MAG: hypothetical protein GY769_07885 [bacterium]|nr:hypothetical protein [bacterium]